MSSQTILLHRVKENIFLVDDMVYLDAINKLYPKYKDQAFDNYLKILEKKK